MLPIEFEQRLAAAWPSDQWQDVSVVVAVSGGPDSVALLRALASLHGGAGCLLVAHLNHGWRGSESDDDQQFVVELCRNQGLDCQIGQADRGRNGEAAARAARYQFFEQVAREAGARFVVTGHTADDQAETILHRILRGTGIAGLAGIPRTRPLNELTSLIRPLLGFFRQEVYLYLEQIGQTYRDDSTNQATSFTRNRLRHQLLPQLAAEYNPRVVDALLRLGSLAGEVQGVIDGLVTTAENGPLDTSDPQCVRLVCSEFSQYPPLVVREVLIAAWKRRCWPLEAMGREQWDELGNLVRANHARAYPLVRDFPGAVRAIRGPVALTLERITPPARQSPP